MREYSSYSETISISPLGIAFLILLGVIVVAFIIFRRKLPSKIRLYTALVIAVLIGFAAGVTIDEYALSKSGNLTKYHRQKLPERYWPYDDCANC